MANDDNNLIVDSRLRSRLIDGLGGNDTIDGQGGRDTLIGGAGDDVIVVRGSELQLRGGEGFDTLRLIAPVVVDLGNAVSQIPGSIDAQGFESVDASVARAGVVVHLSAGADSFLGSRFDDTVFAIGNGDTVDGGVGRDTFVLTTAGTVDLNAGSFSGASGALIRGLENVDASAAFGPVQLIGDDQQNRLVGGVGDDTLLGGAGDDTLDGGGLLLSSSDSLDGGDGSDTIVITTGQEVIVFLGEGQAFTFADPTSPLSTFLNFAGVESVDLTENGARSQIVDSADNNSIRGGEAEDVIAILEGGADHVQAGGGNDTVIGGSGDDQLLDGGLGIDELNYVTDKAITIKAGARDSTIGDAVKVCNFEIFNFGPSAIFDIFNGASTGTIKFFGSKRAETVIGGDAADTLKGCDGDDDLTGGLGADKLHGGNGNDTLRGTAGDDRLVGGAGADLFAFTAGQSGQAASVIHDFRHAQGDRIDVSGIDANIVNGAGDDSFTFIGFGAFTGVAQFRVSFDSAADAFILQMNTDANTDTVEQSIVLKGAPFFALADLIL